MSSFRGVLVRVALLNMYTDNNDTIEQGKTAVVKMKSKNFCSSFFVHGSKSATNARTKYPVKRCWRGGRWNEMLTTAKLIGKENTIVHF